MKIEKILDHGDDGTMRHVTTQEKRRHFPGEWFGYYNPQIGDYLVEALPGRWIVVAGWSIEGVRQAINEREAEEQPESPAAQPTEPFAPVAWHVLQNGGKIACILGDGLMLGDGESQLIIDIEAAPKVAAMLIHAAQVETEREGGENGH